MMEFLLCVGERIAPGIAELDEAGRARVAEMIQHALDRRRPAVRRQLALFLSILRWTPVLRYGRRFDRLQPPEQDAMLRWFHDAPVTPLRQGFWGVKTLIYMGYYGRPEIAETIGYRPSRTGNSVLVPVPASASDGGDRHPVQGASPHHAIEDGDRPHGS